MAVWLVTGPTIEPVDLADAKLAANFAEDQTDKDNTFTALIQSEREKAESFTGRAFITQTWDRKYDCGFPDVIELPKPPVQSVTSITYVDTNGITQTLSPSLYVVDKPTGPYAMPARIVPAYGTAWPQTRDMPSAVTVRFVCGYGDDAESVPASIRQAITMGVCTHLAITENVVVGTIASVVPMSGEHLLWPFKYEL